MGSSRASTTTALERVLGFAFLTVVIVGAVLEITNVARLLRSLIVLVGIGANAVLVLRNAGRVNRVKDAQHEKDRAAQRDIPAEDQ
jgi:hypothetical protein